MKKILLLLPAVVVLSAAVAQKENKDIKRKLYLAQVKAAESLLRLNETADARRMLDETDPSFRGFEWDLLHAMSDRSVLTLEGHTKGVVGIALTDDGHVLASGSADSSIVLWDARSGKKIATLTGHKGQVTSLDFNAAGTQLVSGSTDRTLKLWDVATHKEITTIKKDFFRGIYQCRFSPGGNQVGIASWEFLPDQAPPVQGFAMVLSVPDGAVVRRFNTDHHPASALDFSNQGDKLLTATWGMYVKQHDIESGNDDWAYDVNDIGYYAAFQSCDLSPDGKKIVTGGKDNQIRMLDAATGKLIYCIEPSKGHQKWVNAVRFSGDGKMFASGSDDQLVKVWEAATGKLLHSFRGHTNNIHGLVFSKDNKTIFSSSGDGTIKKWDLDQPGQYSFDVCNSGPWNAPVSADGKWIAAACLDSVLNIWDLDSRAIVQSYKGINAIAADFNPGMQYLASGSSKLNVFDLGKNESITETGGHKSRITGMAWSPSKNYIATASGDGTVRIWNEKGDSVKMITTKTGSPYSVTFTPDGKRLVVGMGNGKIKLYDANWAEIDSVHPGTSLFDLEVDPKGRYVLAGGSKGQLFLWDLQKREISNSSAVTATIFTVLLFIPMESMR